MSQDFSYVTDDCIQEHECRFCGELLRFSPHARDEEVQKELEGHRCEMPRAFNQCGICRRNFYGATGATAYIVHSCTQETRN